MRSYEDRAVAFLKRIYPIIRGELSTPWQVRRLMDEFNEKYNRDVQVYYGSARAAIVTSDYVIKWEWDPDEAEYIGGFENELNLYYEAEMDGFAYLFAKLTPFEYRDTFFCIMPRIKDINNDNGSAWNYLTNEEKTWCQCHCLTDLHSGNYGFKDGKVCIFDYGYIEY